MELEEQEEVPDVASNVPSADVPASQPDKAIRSPWFARRDESGELDALGADDVLVKSR